MTLKIVERLYFFASLGVFAHAVFVCGFTPWYFALMIVLDLLYFAYTVNLNRAQLVGVARG